ncbi:MAG: ornithine carbamoyltransferase [Oscillospiraceae bacterium]|nr:ornithine carbamoyltransferase [Oscillospiraceae bacterium]
MKGRDFLKLLDFTPEEITKLIDLAAELKAQKKAGIPHKLCQGKNIALIFEKTSTRTRCSFEVAAYDLGMGVTYLDPTGSQIGKKESIADTARVLASIYDGIEYRGFGQEIVEELAKYASVPVWNGLTNEFHPTQILADMLTIREQFGRLQGINFVYMGDARYNMGNSLMVGCAKLGLNFTACCPEKYFPNKALIAQCQEIAKETGAVLRFETDPGVAVENADVIYTDVWVSMGEPAEVWRERIEELSPYQVNTALMAATGKKETVFMHCLPAFHDMKTTIGKEMGEKFNITAMEVTDEVFESSQSIVFQEAENRMHTIKAVMAATLQQRDNARRP